MKNDELPHDDRQRPPCPTGFVVVSWHGASAGLPLVNWAFEKAAAEVIARKRQGRISRLAATWSLN